MGEALVLAGGGVAGIAWEIGVLRGIADHSPSLAASLVGAGTLIGTSAGSTVAAQISTGRSLDELYSLQLADEHGELSPDLDLAALVSGFAAAAAGATDAVEVRRRIGALALETPTVDEAARRAVIEWRLAGADWPARDLRVVAVDAATGAEVVFTPSSGVSLIDAVAASCAVPGVWPPVTIDGRRHIDGGVRSSANADLAAGCDPVVIITPAAPGAPSIGTSSLADEVAGLAPSAVVVVHADEASTAAFGTNPLSPATRRPAALAGRAAGQREAPRIAEVWGER